MNSLQEWIVQLRYPYTAFIIAVIWVGTVFLIAIDPDAHLGYLLGLATASTIILSVIGFSSKR